MPDERARLRAAGRAARGRRLPRARGDADAGRRRVQHLRGARERRQPALRQPRPSAAGQEQPPRHADRGRRLPGAEGARVDHPARALGRRRVRHAQHRLAARAARARPRAEEAQVEIEESLETFPSTLPARRESAYAAWVAISVGCNNTCTFCIVPSLRGKEKDRRPGDMLAEIRRWSTRACSRSRCSART